MATLCEIVACFGLGTLLLWLNRLGCERQDKEVLPIGKTISFYVGVGLIFGFLSGGFLSPLGLTIEFILIIGVFFERLLLA